MAATLTLIAIKARQVIKYGIILFFVIVIGRILLIFAINAYKTYVPKPPPPPTVGFGRLAAIPFPKSESELPKLELTINTPTGQLPSFPEQMKVFYMPQKTATLFSFDRMKALAGSFGFTGEPIQQTETLYMFNHPTLPATFRSDIVYETFSLSFNLNLDSSPLSERAPDVQSASDVVRQALQNAKSMPEDLGGPITSEFLRVESQNLVRALALSDAMLTKINLHRKPVSEGEGKPEYASVTASPKEGNVWFIVSGTKDRGKALIAGEYHYFPVDQTRFETYPLKSVSKALEDLNAGKGYIANLGLNTEGKVTIRNIYLAYYDPDVPYTYYQPVIVFEGDGEFTAYVPAVNDDYYGEETSE